VRCWGSSAPKALVGGAAERKISPFESLILVE